jgi:N-acyl-D-amino-acid deacylase
MNPMRWTLSFLALLAALSTAGVSLLSQPATFDVLILNGRVMDGSGNPWIAADLGIKDGRIVQVARRIGGTAQRTIDASGRLVTPGFIDAHSHAGESLATIELRQARPVLAQGVTTLVINPDGGGPVDLAGQREQLMSGGIGPNVAQLIGHASVRRKVMGAAGRAATGGEVDEMTRLVAAATSSPYVFGLSSGLFYTPGSFATTEEVIALARPAGAAGGVYTSHIRDEGNYNVGVVAAVDEVIRIAEEGHVVGIATHLKALGPDNWGLGAELVRHIDAARARGVQVFADQYPYEASSTSLRAALLPGGVELPTAELIAGGRSDLSEAERQSLSKVESLIRENLRRRGGADAIQIAFFKPDPSMQGMRLSAIAKKLGVSADKAALQLMARGSASIVSFNMSEKDIELIMKQPWTMASSDGGLVLPASGQPHPRDYGAFARRLNVYVRERGVVPLEFAIRSMTSLPAAVFGMKDRGMIREGAAADIAVFDPSRVRDRATYEQPHQLAEGIDWVLVNGVVVIENGRFTEALPGTVVNGKW